jgi:Na+-translocating ferredoxin:NAD+ oxidoreductase RnfA subunit
MEYIEIIIATIFVNNILLAQFLGNCPFLGTSKKMETAIGHGNGGHFRPGHGGRHDLADL